MVIFYGLFYLACGGILLWVVWRVVVICYGLLCGDLSFFMVYFVASDGNFLWNMWREVLICYGLLCVECW